jgi:hypothetical protein
MKRERGAEGADRRRYEAGALLCVECATHSDREAWGWRAHRIDDPENRWQPEIIFYCPACAEREFGRR